MARRVRSFNASAALLAVALLAAPAQAQRPLPPGDFGPAGQLPQGSPVQRIQPLIPPAVAPPSAVVPPPQAALPASGSVTVSSVGVDGSTAYPAGQLDPLIAGLTGPAVPIERVQAARQAILARYRRDGYVLTAIAVTLDRQHRLRFVVTEGRIADVKLDGDIGPAGVQVLRFLRHLTEVQPIDAASLERWLLLAQDVPGISLRAVLRPSTEQPGALTLVAVVSRQAFSGLFTADNYAYRLTGPEEGLLVLDANSFTSLGERTEVSMYGAARGTQLFGQATSQFFVGGSGLQVRLYAGSGTSDPSGFLGAEQYHGVTTTAGVAALYPWIRARQQTLNLGLYFDILQSDIQTFGAPASEDNLRVVRAGADYVRDDIWLGAARNAVNAVTIRVSHGIDGLGSSANGQVSPPPGRQGEQVDFSKVNFEVSRTQTLFSPWRDATVALEGLLAGQYTGDVLPPSEEFYLGGPRYNPGFYSGEVTGDSALVAYAELQLNTGFTVNWFARPLQIGTQLYGFADWGQTWNNHPTGLPANPNQRLKSVGGGLRLNITQYTEFDLQGVARLTREPQGVSSDTPELAAGAVYWRVLTRF